MRVVSVDGREVIATNEELSSASTLPEETLRHAQHLNLSFNALTSLQSLRAATQLRNLNVSHNAIASLCGVETFRFLRLLRLSSNSVSDLSWLAGLPSLQELWMNDNQIETSQIAHLVTLRALETLVLHPNPCTNAVNYISYVVKTVPWLARVDLVVVDDLLRRQSQHLDERSFLSSAETDISEISLMTARSDDHNPRDATISQEQALATSDIPAMEKPTIAEAEVKVPTKKSKKMTAEDFMRSFPVQEFIPETCESVKASDDPMASQLPAPIGTQSVEQREQQVHGNSNQDYHEDRTQEAVESEIAHTNDPRDSQKQNNGTQLSAIASAVHCLPLFGDEGTLRNNKKPSSGPAAKLKKVMKDNTACKPLTTSSALASLASFSQQEWVTTYPSSMVNAVHVRADGSALAKWPGGSVAVSVDRERNGFRCYAAHKDGTIALSFDSDGVGFINYYPSGRMMISTSSSGDGLYFSSEGLIVRQWDTQLNIKNDKWEATDSLSDTEPDGALVAKLSDGLGVRLQLGKRKDGLEQSSAIVLTIFFNSGTGIRHSFCNWINNSESTAGACAAVFGNDVPKLKKKASGSRSRTHSDTLHDIRAAVAKLS